MGRRRRPRGAARGVEAEHAQTRRALLEAESAPGFSTSSRPSRAWPRRERAAPRVAHPPRPEAGRARCVYGELDPDEDRIFVAQDHCDGWRELVGEHRLELRSAVRERAA